MNDLGLFAHYSRTHSLRKVNFLLTLYNCIAYNCELYN